MRLLHWLGVPLICLPIASIGCVEPQGNQPETRTSNMPVLPGEDPTPDLEPGPDLNNNPTLDEGAIDGKPMDDSATPQTRPLPADDMTEE